MILPSQEIERLSSDPQNGLDMIDPIRPQHVRASSYDLTVGDEYYIGKEAAPSALSTQTLNADQTFTIPPHAVCFILSAESIHLPPDVTAKVSLRMTHIYAGMILSSQPPFDPLYKGRVVVMLNNLSSEPFHLKRGERVATIEFSRLESQSSNPRTHRSVGTLQAQLSKPLISSLTEIASLSKSAHGKVDSLIGQLLGFAALLVALLAVPGLASYNTLADRLGTQNDRLKDMSQTLDDYKRDLERSHQRIEELEKRMLSGATQQPAHVIGLKQSSASVTSAKK